MEEMAPSTRWAMERLEKANTIYEPSQKSWAAQTFNVIVWTLECLYVLWVAFGVMAKG